MSLPVTVLGGYLGAGKTTLLNRLLRGRRGGERFAVLVNDFGSVSIDAALIESSDDAVLRLAGGCICCSFGADLVGTLRRVVDRERVDAILIEASGVALPRSVARAVAIVPGVHCSVVATLADATAVSALAADPYVGDVVLRQLEDADLILLTKCETAPATEVSLVHDWLAQRFPYRVICPVGRPGIALETLGRWRIAPQADAMPAPITAAAKPLARAIDRFVTRSFEVPDMIDVRGLGAALAALEPPLDRAKGVLGGRSGESVVLQIARRQVSIEPARPGVEPTPLVCVAAAPGAALDAVQALVDAAGCHPVRSRSP